MITRNSEILHWVQGNQIELAIPLQKVNFASDDSNGYASTVSDYEPPQDSTVSVVLKSNFCTYTYTPTSIEGNIIYIVDNGAIMAGAYGVIVIVEEQNGTKRRSRWDGLVYVHDYQDKETRGSDTAPSWVDGSMIDWDILPRMQLLGATLGSTTESVDDIFERIKGTL